MATSSNKLIPILAVTAVAIVVVVLVKQFSGTGAVKADNTLKSVPHAELPAPKGADRDTPEETLRTVTTSNEKLRGDVEQVLRDNKDLRKQLDELRKKQAAPGANTAASASAAAAPATPVPSAAAAAPADEPSTLERAVTSAAGTVDSFASTFPGNTPKAATGTPPRAGSAQTGTSGPDGAIHYQLVPPMGYAIEQTKAQGAGGVEKTRFVRTTLPETGAAAAGAGGPATRAAQQAQAQKSKDVPYFTIPENATLVGALAMTSLIGRVPIDGRVTDPMQFKAVIGRDNLAANGLYLPPDVAGMIVTGITIGDMALSCNEGRVHSATFVFNDGTISTTSARSSGASGGVNTRSGGFGASANNSIGFISDEHGNPCISGKFVTNAPAYLTDVVGLGALGVAGQAYSDAQRTTYAGRDGATSVVTGNVGSYALGQAVAGGTNEVTKWMMSRLNNSFDAVVTPSGQKLVIHLDREIDIDKKAGARKLVFREQADNQLARGARYGLE